MKNIRLIAAYDGTAYLGWQKTRMGPSIEGTLQPIIEKILQSPIQLQAASRTDAGVHVRCQVINFFTERGTLDLNKFLASLNRLLPDDISILAVDEVPLEFHPSLNAHKKEYRYYVTNGPVQYPEHRHYSWHYPKKLDILKMRFAAQMLIGEHDFSAFCNVMKNREYQHTRRILYRLEIHQLNDERLCFVVEGNSFLYKMVRNIVGTLIYVGCGKIEVDNVEDILCGRKRIHAGVTAPAHGLTLHRIEYSEIFSVPEILSRPQLQML